MDINGKNITDFFVNIDWELEIRPPSVIASLYPENLNDNSIYISNTSLPSTAVDLILFTYYGENNFQTSSGFITDNFNVTIRNDSNGKNYQFFRKWQDLRMVNQGRINTPILLNYPDYYKGEIDIILRNNQTRTIKHTEHFIKCYPNAIGDVQLESEEPNVGEFEVTFTFGWNYIT